MSATSTIEELVFELAEEHTSGELEKLISLLDLVLNGKKSLEAKAVSSESPAPAKATASKSKAAKATPTVESNDSGDEEEPF
jgi:hypothetical protein